MTQTDEDRLVLIKKLLAKAEAKGTTTEEAEAFSAKATDLMVRWSIDDAMIAAADRLHTEKIEKRIIAHNVPVTYSHEFALITYHVAQALGCRPVLTNRGRVVMCIVVGFATDVDRVFQLSHSLTIQATMALGRWYRISVKPWWSGSDKYNAKRSFITGFAEAAGAKIKAVQVKVIQETGHGTEIVLVGRKAEVDRWVQDNMDLRNGRPRRQLVDGLNAGRVEGARANVGGHEVGPSRRAIGG